MRRGLSQATRHFIAHGERGQTIVILAFGIIVLLAFVGIVTDVSLMFVRFSTLRRAVDASAVAAAGQVRRLVPEVSEWEKAGGVYNTAQQYGYNTFGRDEPIQSDWVYSGANANTANGLAFARNIANIKLAAESFIEFYGLDPVGVLVETCATNPSDTDLCTEDQRKLIRVTAQINSPTVFLRLIGWGDIVLESSSVSETAALDVVILMDVSESMLHDTTYEDWETIPWEPESGNTGTYNQGYHYIPPRMTSNPASLNIYTQYFPASYYDAWNYVLNSTWDELAADARFAPIAYDPTGSAISEPRDECRVRFYPGAALLGPRDDTFPADLRAEYTAYLGETFPTSWDGFIPTYDFYGCCNDPNGVLDGSGNYNFTDLICQPFRQARDATEQFLQRIDFVRGDRVAFVTFDRSAHLMLPPHTPGDTVSHMIDNETDALNTLRRAIGVRAENNFYADTNNDGYWDHFVTKGEYGHGGVAIQYDGAEGFDSTDLGAVRDYPARDSCPFINALLAWPKSLWSVPLPGAAIAGFPYHPDSDEQPMYYETPLLNIMNPRGVDWDTHWLTLNGLDGGLASTAFRGYYSYEFRASCSGTNMGAALRTAYAAFTDPDTRRDTGSVWVMVLLSDGAAGASDPVRRNGLELTQANPYNDPTAYDPLTSSYPNRPTAGDYGAFGLCPFGTPDNPGELVDDATRQFPYCSDNQPDTRHVCFDPATVYDDGGSANFYIELSNARYPNCQYEYDVDDYARDWADFVGLEEPFPWYSFDPGDTEAIRIFGQRTSGVQLPTIFTIGFGIHFSSGSGTCAENVADCLGEELLRYIADVGDNQRVDTDYQQDWRNDNAVDFVVDGSYGSRGPCEGPVLGGYASADQAAQDPGADISVLINPLPPGDSCGNYYNAPSGSELNLVFDDIASRMFTQLAH